jgi:PAS domain S-box-containing protein
MDLSKNSISILIIEDNAGDQLLLEESLKSTQLLISNITAVSTLTEAFNILSRQSFSLIFLDLFLPDSSGLESFTELLKLCSKIPIIISSGLSDTQVALNAISLGAQDFLIKSDHDTKMLEKTVRYSIERKKNLEIIEEKNEKVLLSEQRFKSLVQNGADLITIIDNDANYLYVSPTAKKILGYEQEFFVGKNAAAFIHPDDLVNFHSYFSIIKTKKYLARLIFRVKNAEEEWRWMESSVTDLTDDAAVRGIVANSRDITDKKIAEDEIKKLSLVAKETINGVIITDEKQKILWVNNAFKKMCGYELEEIIGKKPGHFLQGPDTEAEVVEFIKAKIAEKVPFVFEILNYTKSGNKVYLRNQIQPLFDNKGAVEKYFSLLTDITEQKLLEEKMALEKVIRQKEITEAVIAAQESERSEIGRELHDNVNQLLGATRLYINMARKDDNRRDTLLKSSSEFTLKAIDEIRKLSKTLITPLIKEVGLTDTIKDLVDDITVVHPVQIHFDAAGFSDGILNEKFKLNLFRIVQEQLNNTLKHAKASEIKINIGQTNDKLSLCISDDGVGFDTTKPKKGVGISNIVSRAELYKGDVKLISEPGKGCTLSITFNKSELLLN